MALSVVLSRAGQYDPDNDIHNKFICLKTLFEKFASLGMGLKVRSGFRRSKGFWRTVVEH